MTRSTAEKGAYGSAVLTAAVTLVVGVAQVLPEILWREPAARNGVPVSTTSGAPTLPATPANPAATTVTADPQPQQQVICVNGDGDGNTNNCGLPPRSFGKISYSFGPVLWAYHAGSLADLRGPTGEGSDRPDCSRWGAWLASTPDLYVVAPVVDFGMEAGDADLAVISRVAVEIFERVPANADGTPVKCLFGGGSDEFYNVSVDTATGTATVREETLGGAAVRAPYPIPPASITLADGGHAGVRIAIDSLDGYFYEGSLVVTTSLNGTEKVFRIGTEQQPFRWMTPDADWSMDQSLRYVGWDGEGGRWVEQYSGWSG
jgi:hypothetical protein